MKGNANKAAAAPFLSASPMQPETAAESDACLLKSFAEGDAAALERLVGRYRSALFSWLLGMTANRADAEDLYQEVWVRIIRHAARFHDVSFRAWMWKIARNLLIDFRRKRKPVVSLDVVSDEEDRPLIEQLADTTAGPVERVERGDLKACVMRAVKLLPEVQREVFLMRVQGDLPFHEIAKTLDIPLNTALGRMHDAMTKLKRMLAEENLR